jgi:hypothetical protein
MAQLARRDFKMTGEPIWWRQRTLLTGYLDMAAEGQAEFGQPACQFFDPL